MEESRADFPIHVAISGASSENTQETGAGAERKGRENQRITRELQASETTLDTLAHQRRQWIAQCSADAIAGFLPCLRVSKNFAP